MNTARKSGILLHPTSLSGDFCIGDLGAGAYAFLDWLALSGQTLWQILPLGPTGAGDSPYQPFSSFAGNETLLSPDILAEKGFMTGDERDSLKRSRSRVTDYGEAFFLKLPLLKRAASRFKAVAGREDLKSFGEFTAREAHWLDDYAVFMSIKREFEEKARRAGVEGAMWASYWPRDLARRDGAALASWKATHAEDIETYRVLQYFFHSQWTDLKRYANGKGIEIIGDTPIFVAYDSSDAWSHPDLFQFDGDLRPVAVAGVPPDYFSETGQLWGNPLYAWERHEETGFEWWISRVEAALKLTDLVRIDHFRGFDAYWAVPAADTTARNGTWMPAPGKKLLDALKRDLGHDIPIIAEDLGFITDGVRDLRDSFGLPGMKILQFAFDSQEAGAGSAAANEFLPHNYPVRSVVYPGTHDNDTLSGWLAKAKPGELASIDRYLGYVPKDRADALLREAVKSVAEMAVIPMQDILKLGTEARMNFPSVASGNWRWRILDFDLDSATASNLRELTETYGRN